MRFVPIWRGIAAVLGGEFISPPAGKALAFHAIHNDRRALSIGQFTGVVTKVELFAVAAKLRFAHMVMGADDAALENRKEVFCGVAVLVTAKAGELLNAVIDRVMRAELTTDALLDGALVDH